MIHYNDHKEYTHPLSGNHKHITGILLTGCQQRQIVQNDRVHNMHATDTITQN